MLYTKCITSLLLDTLTVYPKTKNVTIGLLQLYNNALWMVTTCDRVMHVWFIFIFLTFSASFVYASGELKTWLNREINVLSFLNWFHKGCTLFLWSLLLTKTLFLVVSIHRSGYKLPEESYRFIIILNLPMSLFWFPPIYWRKIYHPCLYCYTLWYRSSSKDFGRVVNFGNIFNRGYNP